MLSVDTREPESIKEYAQSFFDKKLHVEIEELKVGDIQYGNIIIERKRIDDLVSSIIDGRFKNQKKNLVQKQNEGYHCYVIIQGEYQDLTDHALPKKAVAGAIASLNEYGIHTIHVGYYDYEMMFEIIHGLMRKYNEEKIVESVFVEPDTDTWTEKSLMCIKGVGKQTAHDIVEIIPHLQRFYETTPEHNKELLMEINGIGEKTADAILGVIYDNQ